MTHHLLSERLRTAVQELIRVAAARAEAESEAQTSFRARNEAADQEFNQARQTILAAFSAAQTTADREYQDTCQHISTTFEKEHRALSEEYSRLKHKINYLYTQGREKTEADFKESRWTISTVYDSDKKVIKENQRKAQTRVESASTRINAVHQEAVQRVLEWNLGAGAVPMAKADAGRRGLDPFRGLDDCLASANTSLANLKELTITRYAKGLRTPLILMGIWMLVSAPALLFESWYIWLAVSTLAVLVVGWLARAALKRAARIQVAGCFFPLAQAVADADSLRQRCLDYAAEAYREQRSASRKQHLEMMRQAVKKCRRALRELTRTRDQDLHAAKRKYPPRLADLVRRRDTELRQAEEKHAHAQKEHQTRRDQDLQHVTERYQRRRDDSNRRHAQDWTTMVSAWKQGIGSFRVTVEEVDQECRRLFPSWQDAAWDNWQPPRKVPLGLQFGQLQLTAERIPHALPEDPHLPHLDLSGLSFPALLPFPERAALLCKASEDGRAAAIELLQALLVRLLTSIPPGKVRLTILDPVSRGENFAAFMHLADHDELLVTSRIWTESSHIEQRLSDLTAHMENVLQKYLRNQYETLEEYNAQAGEVAEPYRILVVANFPVNFSPDAARRLVSLANSGPRCGIHTLITVDTKQPLPQGFNLDDLEQGCTILNWHEQRLLWIDPDFAAYPLQLDRPPDAAFCTRLMQVIGHEAKLASRVEVPFDWLAPPAKDWWTRDTSGGIAVPLGRAGATGRQLLQLGQGTAQHALVAGKTGSGKSTLLHALITQLALQYSPDEIELYLIDFKKGVEFKTYAAHELPHARVVAVESEREFGLSVLQRLDAELKMRGERFRERGVNDLAGYRETMTRSAPGSVEGNGQHESMPRILLIVDEFQEFFVEDDKTAQEASLLLDRLVRQGRAFGMHILLGSQTLGGAYSLARTTIDQMAVRIALQCSEADAHLILSKDNGAARLLTRPGEAIYNAANGLLEGNNWFQVVWLSDERRDELLGAVHELARQQVRRRPPQIIFEGMAPSELQKNPLLKRLLEEPLPATPPNALYAWLGEAIAIKDPTAALFRRQSGANLIMVGQNDEAAFNMMVAALVSLAAQTPREANGLPQFSFVAGNPLEGPAEELSLRLPDLLPVQAVSARDLPAMLAALAEEVERRQQTPGGPPLFLFVHGLQRLRDLRRADDDFGFSRQGERPSPAKFFANLVREGPTFGVHVIAWCDNYNNLQRALDRQALREFEMRVLFQMSAADSSNLIDAPIAAKLGQHRALFYTEDQGRAEKFRPYGLVSADWLQQLKTRLNQQPVLG